MDKLSATQKAINFIVKNKDIHHLQSVHAVNSADFYEGERCFAPGGEIFELLQKNKISTIACNIVSYNQIEGHLRAANKQNSIIILEIARSQLDYAMDENKFMEYVKKNVERLGCSIPIVLHGDHIQYSSNFFNQTILLKKICEQAGVEYNENKIDSLDKSIVEKVKNELEINAKKEREEIASTIERLIRAGFTSIAIDASTVYDEIGGDIVMDYYEQNGTDAEKIIIKLEKEFKLALDWGTDVLKLDIKRDKAEYDRIHENIIADMRKRGKSDKNIEARIKEFENNFGSLAEASRKSGIELKKLVDSYEKIMEDVALATVVGEIDEKILANTSENKKTLLLPTSNAKETEYQLKKIEEILKKVNPEMIESFGREIEVGHVDKKIPNPRLGGKLEFKLTHPITVRVMGEYIQNKNLKFHLIATNNGSGHGTQFDKESLTPISQVDKISPYLTSELQREAQKFKASIVQHGTSGSDMDELAELSRRGVIKFNIATNYQQIILNILSLLHDGLEEDKLLDYVFTNQITLAKGLAEKTRENIKILAHEIEIDKKNAEIKNNDSLFTETLKKTYAWGLKKGKIKETSSHTDIGTIFAKEHKRVFKEMSDKFYQLGTRTGFFKISTCPKCIVPDDPTSQTTSITSAVLTSKGWRGKAIGLDKNNYDEKEKIHKIKDESDEEAKKIYEKIVKENKIILMVRASEGFSRDGVEESFKANDLIIPDEIMDEISDINKSIKEGKSVYKSKSNEEYKIENAIIDVIENTNSFVTNVGNKSLANIEKKSAGASSVMVAGPGVKSIGNIPDYYADGIFTMIPKEKRQNFFENPLDPELTANDPKKQEEILIRVAKANEIEINDLEIVIMDRTRESERLAFLHELAKKYNGLKITTILDGTVAHSLQASLGRKTGKHKIYMSVGAAPEGFYNLAIASMFKEEGTLGSIRIYSKNINKTKSGEKSKNLARRYDFDEKESTRIKELRYDDAEKILNGKKLFTQNDVEGDIHSSFSFITHSGVFNIRGVKKLPQGFYSVKILRVARFAEKPCAWFEEKIIKTES